MKKIYLVLAILAFALYQCAPKRPANTPPSAAPIVSIADQVIEESTLAVINSSGPSTRLGVIADEAGSKKDAATN